MTNSKSTLLSDHGNALEAKIYASRPGIATVTKIPDHVEGVAVKVTVIGELGEGDYVVRSVRAGTKYPARKMEVLFGVVPASVASNIEGFKSDVSENRRSAFEAGSCIWLCTGNEVASIANAVRVTV